MWDFWFLIRNLKIVKILVIIYLANNICVDTLHKHFQDQNFSKNLCFVFTKKLKIETFLNTLNFKYLEEYENKIILKPNYNLSNLIFVLC